MTSDFYHSRILPYAGIIIKICRAYTANQQDFEDYYQEVCLQIWRSHENFRDESDWSTWVYRLSLNVCMTLFKRKRNRYIPVALDNETEIPDNETHTFPDEELNRLYRAIRQLGEVDKAVILLYLEEKPYGEIAEIMGTNANNIGVRIKRIKKRLKKILDGIEN